MKTLPLSNIAIPYYFEKWTSAQNKYKPDVHKIDPRFPEEFAWKSYAPIWEYYSPNKDCNVYEERIYMPVKLANTIEIK